MPWERRLVLDQRTDFCLQAMQNRKTFVELCREFNISPKTGYKWKQRFLEDGMVGLHDRSRRPKRSPSMLGEDVVCEMVALKQHHRHWGPKKIREVYGRKHDDRALPSLSSFKRVLEKCGLVEKRRRRRSQETGRIRNRFEATEPNDVWTVDFKGWWYTSGGERCEPLSVRDDYSRYLLGLSVPESCRTEPVKSAFEGLFERYGLPRVIRSDNGVPFASENGPMGLTRLSVWWLSLGIDLDRIRPGCPSENGGHERMHRDIAMELEGNIRGDVKQQEAVLGIWRRQFNEERPHEALGMKCPSEVYESSPRRYEGTPDLLEYPPGFFERRVSRKGAIKYKGKDIFVSVVFGGWNIGLEPMGDGSFSVYFDRLRLGRLDPRSEVFEAVSDRLEKRSADATE